MDHVETEMAHVGSGAWGTALFGPKGLRNEAPRIVQVGPWLRANLVGTGRQSRTPTMVDFLVISFVFVST